jgi:hypothetical protein
MFESYKAAIYKKEHPEEKQQPKSYKNTMKYFKKSTGKKLNY